MTLQIGSRKIIFLFEKVAPPKRRQSPKSDAL
jgi:hypothetical protein